MELFNSQSAHFLDQPLPERLRPQSPEDLIGQKEAQKWLSSWKDFSRLPNLILWGPPGSGKTTSARIIMDRFQGPKKECNAIQTGAKELRELGDQAREHRLLHGQRTLLFVDEIHRLNKSQQDVLLPFAEKSDLILVGATTENPSYSLNPALLSRCQMVVFKRLTDDEVGRLLQMALEKENCTDLLDSDGRSYLVQLADGDARRLLSQLDILIRRAQESGLQTLLTGTLQDWLSAQPLRYDRNSDQHYDLISALIKSIRGSDADASLYYLARMIKGGEDPTFIARRLVILASEDVGNADPRALSVAVSCAQAVEMIGLPEAGINLAQAVTYLAAAPKSNRSYLGWKMAQDLVEKTGTRDVPLRLRSSRTSSMKALGYGRDYQYPHDFEKAYVEQDYWPEGIKTRLYEPSTYGFEKSILEYEKWRKG